MKHRIPILCAVLGLSACHAVRPSSHDDCSDPFGIATTSAKIPALGLRADASGAALTGYVADSATGHGLKRAVAFLKSADSRDSVAVYTDSVGGFSIRGLRPMRYSYSARSINFRMRRDSISLRVGLDTLLVRLPRGLALCNVRVTEGAWTERRNGPGLVAIAVE